jgi:hypothetical protein
MNKLSQVCDARQKKKRGYDRSIETQGAAVDSR